MGCRAVLAFVVLLAACTGGQSSTTAPQAGAASAPLATTPDPTPTAAVETPTPSIPSTPLAEAFGIDRVDTACRAFDAHLTNAARDRMLDIYVDAERLGLSAGTHTIRLGPTGAETSIELVEFDRPLTGERDCTDLESDNAPAVARRWRATSGRLVVTFRDAPSTERETVVDVELIDVTLTDDAGTRRTVGGRFASLRVGWLPG